ncbi:TIGR03960 family B12-binding radical SAM protein [Caldicellulosiruptor acetigenus]|uniref:TIGR03960 family B12-binding radical SAM protein n=1 Tax=Caldicellulosiruptor acetigenus TaxID=301953 RepID=UPI00041D8417|nr:TIGR03960 family B12-binding radical SAM protein [Caldicellulosiruptor acetigenus]WAM36813.1 TIGR03960 family B12-binding radical SAM protein [Caldicellulosiruptor acetigenus]
MCVKDKVFKLLYGVEKPGRYIGNEINMVKKDPAKVDVRFAFCFPDVYEIGMSNLGLKILYHLLNEREDVYCERAFMPWVDMQQQMKKEGIKLFSLETFTELDKFDIIGFSLSYEMSYTNLLKMLELCGLPLESKKREKGMPIIIAGGPCTYNPEPLWEFVDVFVIGEGEEVILEFIDLYKKYKFSSMTKDEFLFECASIQGCYVPSLYNVKYNQDGTIKSIVPVSESVPAKVKKRIVKNLDTSYFPTRMITPLIEVVHDRITLEIFRGCARGCRFCQAGVIYRPVRFRSSKKVLQYAKELVENCGCNEISLVSLSTSDYPNIDELAREILKFAENKKVNISLPSLRLDSTSLDLLKEVEKVRKPTLTFAPEAGTQRLRDVINKNIKEEDIYSTVKLAFERGFQNIKLYFMLGLPLEEDEDVLGIYTIAKNIREIYKELGLKKRVRIPVSTSFFVPKPHTPFQWEAQDSIENMQRKMKLLKENLKKVKDVEYSWHDFYLSKLEAVLSRGDRRLSKVIKRAVELGCQFDDWSEFFDFSKWERAFQQENIDWRFYSDRKRSFDEILPWDIIDTGVTKEFLKKECLLAYEAKTTSSCFERCTGCGVASFRGGICVGK